MDEHRWKSSFREYIVTPAVATFAPEDGSCPPAMLANPRPLREEILRLAREVEATRRELTTELTSGRAEIAEIGRRADNGYRDLCAEIGASLGLSGQEAEPRLCLPNELALAAWDLQNRAKKLDNENALLRRERTLLIELEKTRCGIIGAVAEGREVDPHLFRSVGRLNDALAALHLEAGGGVQRPDGVPCACVLCRPEGALSPMPGHGAECETCFPPNGFYERSAVGTCAACGDEREIFEGRCHDCTSSGRYREGRL